jgi:hypothetical protein
LAYQPDVWESYDGRTAVMFGEAAMTETHKAQERLTLVVKPQWVHYKLVETIEKTCSDLLASHQRKCEYAWPTWQNGDVSRLETGDEISSHGDCVQPL